ncbi:hypothetical protein [Oxobacter pfennigii]|uniref:hypothetical protein n=1 Tax=Oxobacter pfennigii TaxID=36849 RepID=UPI001364D708|nr:hypothetical protein [Oxobacter pfennigii]
MNTALCANWILHPFLCFPRQLRFPALMGIEGPYSYKGTIPDGYMVAELEACEMLYF